MPFSSVQKCFKIALLLTTWPSDMLLGYAFRWNSIRPMQKVSYPKLVLPERHVQQCFKIALILPTWPSDMPLVDAFL